MIFTALYSKRNPLKPHDRARATSQQSDVAFYIKGQGGKVIQWWRAGRLRFIAVGRWENRLPFDALPKGRARDCDHPSVAPVFMRRTKRFDFLLQLHLTAFLRHRNCFFRFAFAPVCTPFTEALAAASHAANCALHFPYDPVGANLAGLRATACRPSRWRTTPSA